MDKSEKDFDRLIHEALGREEAEYFDQLGEQNIPQQLLGLFKGKNSWMNVVIFIFNLAVLAVAVYTFIEMLNAEVIGDKLEWMFYTLICFLAMLLFKLWSWNQMDKNAVVREVKRLEYQVALLQQELRDKDQR